MSLVQNMKLHIACMLSALSETTNMDKSACIEFLHKMFEPTNFIAHFNSCMNQ